MNLLKYVNIKYGTNSDQRESNGNVLPNVQLPFGAQSFIIQTHGDRGGWFYDPYVHFMEGIRISNQPSPWVGESFNLLFLPYSGNISFDNFGKYSATSNENLSPAHLELFLNKYQINMKLAPSKNGGNLRLSYKDCPKFLIHGSSLFDEYIIEENKVLCKIQGNIDSDIFKYYIFEFNCSIIDYQEKIEGKKYLSLSLENKEIEVTISTSYISYKQLKLNLTREKSNFEQARIEATKLWNEYLNVITFDSSETEKRIFYSNLYRCFCFPRKISELDVNNKDIYFNFTNKSVDYGIMYSDIGYWDVYRTSIVLLKKLTPKIYQEIIASIIAFYKSYNWLPRWIAPYERGIMPSTLVDITLSDAILSNNVEINDIDIAIEALLKDAYEISTDNHGRENIELYLKYGFLPADLTDHSVSSSLDYFYCDYAIAKVLKKYGYSASEELFERSQGYKKLFNYKTRFFEPLDSNNNFQMSFDPNEWGTNYCESNAWQNNFNVPFALENLIEIMSKEEVLNRLNQIFTDEVVYNVGKYKMEIHEMTEVIKNKELKNFALSNQPSFILPFIYLLIDEEKLFYEKINLAHNYFKEGYPGDEDNGSLSAWYILTCIGEYPINVIDECVTFTPKYKNIKFATMQNK